jgi:hypothetical protein
MMTENCADISRGSKDPLDYPQPIMTLLFLMTLNDTFEENALIYIHPIWKST